MSRAGTNWTPSEDAQLLNLNQIVSDRKEVATKMNRGFDEVLFRLGHLAAKDLIEGKLTEEQIYPYYKITKATWGVHYNAMINGHPHAVTNVGAQTILAEMRALRDEVKQLRDEMRQMSRR